MAGSGEDLAVRLQALMPVALSLTMAGRGPEGLARLDVLPAVAGEVPLQHTGSLVIRGMCRLFTDDLNAAMTDLTESLTRLRRGTSLGYPGQCLVYLAEAEHRLGAWDHALIHCWNAMTAVACAGRVIVRVRLPASGRPATASSP
jgi:hypothetical protein